MTARLHALALHVPSREYHEDLWQAVPEGLAPSDFALRSRFLLGHVKAGERVLDVGCGEGRFTAELAGAGAAVVGIDVAEEPLTRARARHPELDLRLVRWGGAVAAADASFDVVWAGEVIEHVADTAALAVGGSPRAALGGQPAFEHARTRAACAPRLACSRARSASTSTRGAITCASTCAHARALLEDFGFEEIDVRAAAGPRRAGGAARAGDPLALLAPACAAAPGVVVAPRVAAPGSWYAGTWR